MTPLAERLLGRYSPQALALAVIAVFSSSAVAAALVAQHAFNMQPCPWCVLQRLVFLLIAVACALGLLGGALSPSTKQALSNEAEGRSPSLTTAWATQTAALIHRLSGFLVLLLAVCGAAAATFQHTVAAKQSSCSLTLADRLLTALNIEALLPYVFAVTASCAEAAVDVLGIPFEAWSFLAFVLLGGLGAWVMVAKQRPTH